MARSASATTASAGGPSGGHHLTATDHAAAPGPTGAGPTGAGPTGAGPTAPPKRSRASARAGVSRSPSGDPPAAVGNPAKKGGGAARPPLGAVDAPPVDGNGARLSVDELSAASGLEATVLVELQEYGLLTLSPCRDRVFR